jgi:hypothetical protein
MLMENVRYGRKADIGLTGAEWRFLTQADIRGERLSGEIGTPKRGLRCTGRTEITELSVRKRIPVVSRVPVCLNGRKSKAVGASWKKRKAWNRALTALTQPVRLALTPPLLHWR